MTKAKSGHISLQWGRLKPDQGFPPKRGSWGKGKQQFGKSNVINPFNKSNLVRPKVCQGLRTTLPSEEPIAPDIRGGVSRLRGRDQDSGSGAWHHHIRCIYAAAFLHFCAAFLQFCATCPHFCISTAAAIGRPWRRRDHWEDSWQGSSSFASSPPLEIRYPARLPSCASPKRLPPPLVCGKNGRDHSFSLPRGNLDCLSPFSAHRLQQEAPILTLQSAGAPSSFS